MQILLHDDVAAAGELGIFVADHREIDRLASGRILSAIDKADHRAHVEVTKAVHLVDDPDRIAELAEQSGGKLEAEVHRIGADVQQEVTRGRDGDALAGAELPKRLQRRRTGLAEQPVPCAGAEAADTGQIAGRHALTDPAHDCGDVATPRADGVGVAVTLGERRNDEYRAAGDCAGNGLRFGDRCRHRILHVV